ncbi:unnamed protein product [Amoebophrya sp. A25]|nr:unnamed protein product [Amoebophrya sp. A25]|eukprot:GSA25T00005569001.1
MTDALVSEVRAMNTSSSTSTVCDEAKDVMPEHHFPQTEEGMTECTLDATATSQKNLLDHLADAEYEIWQKYYHLLGLTDANGKIRLKHQGHVGHVVVDDEEAQSIFRLLLSVESDSKAVWKVCLYFAALPNRTDEDDMSLGRWLRKTLPGIYTKSKSIADRCRVFVDAEPTTLKQRRRGNDFGSGYSGIFSSDRCIDNLLKYIEEEGNFSGTTGKSSSLLYRMNRQEMSDSDAQEHQKGAGRWCGHRLPKLFTTTYNYAQRWCGKHIFVHVVIPALLSQVGDVQSRDNGKPSMFDAVGEQYPDGSPEADTIEGEDFAEVPNSLISVAPSGKVSSFTEREAVETSFPGDGLWNFRRDVLADLKEIKGIIHRIEAHQLQQQQKQNGGVEEFSAKVSEELQGIRSSHREEIQELRQEVRQLVLQAQHTVSQEIRELRHEVKPVLKRGEPHQQQQEELNHPPLKMCHIPINKKGEQMARSHDAGVPFVSRTTLTRILKSPHEELENQEEERNVQVIKMADFVPNAWYDSKTRQRWMCEDEEANLPHLVYRINFVAPKGGGRPSHSEQIKLLTEAMLLQMCRHDYIVDEEVKRTKEVVGLKDKLGSGNNYGKSDDRLTSTTAAAFEKEIHGDNVDPPREVALGRFNWRAGFLQGSAEEEYTKSHENLTDSQLHHDLQSYIASNSGSIMNTRTHALEVFCKTPLGQSGTTSMEIYRKIVIEFLFITAKPDTISYHFENIIYESRMHLNGDHERDSSA